MKRTKMSAFFLDPIPIRSLPEGEKVLCSIVALIIKECDCYDACKFVACHCEIGIYNIKFVGVDQS